VTGRGGDYEAGGGVKQSFRGGRGGSCRKRTLEIGRLGGAGRGKKSLDLGKRKANGLWRLSGGGMRDGTHKTKRGTAVRKKRKLAGFSEKKKQMTKRESLKSREVSRREGCHKSKGEKIGERRTGKTALWGDQPCRGPADYSEGGTKTAGGRRPF